MLERRTVLNSVIEREEGWIEGLCDGYKNWQTWHGLPFFHSLPTVRCHGGVRIIVSVALGMMELLWNGCNTGGKTSLVGAGLVNKVRRLSAVRHLKFAISSHTCMYSTLYHTHTLDRIRLTRSDKVRIVTVRMCQCVWGNVHWMRIRSEGWTSTWVWPHESPLYTHIRPEVTEYWCQLFTCFW